MSKKNNEEEIVITSDDNLKVNFCGSYTLANKKEAKKSGLSDKFKDSPLGQDIGIHSKGFTSVAILATVIAISVVAILWFMWRF